MNSLSLQPVLVTLDANAEAYARTGPPQASGHTQTLPRQRPSIGRLTERELEVLRLVARGHTAVACGHLLRISPATVRKHLEHAYDKLGVHDRLLAVERARREGLL